jgi:hypothetical protein
MTKLTQAFAEGDNGLITKGDGGSGCISSTMKDNAGNGTGINNYPEGWGIYGLRPSISVA